MLALKVLHPLKWVLLRGNHETRDMNGWVGQYGASSFQHQCSVVFGTANGGIFYELVNNVFDSMPVAAVISDQVREARLACWLWHATEARLILFPGLLLPWRHSRGINVQRIRQHQPGSIARAFISACHR